MFTATVKSRIDEDISILIQQDNHPWNYLAECGDASDLTVKEIQNTNAIFISHTHIDHFVNFDSVIRHQLGIQRRVTICGTADIAQQVQARIKSYTWNLVEADSIVYEIRALLPNNTIQVFELAPPLWKLTPLKTMEGNIIFEQKSFQVSAILLDHKIPTLAYKFEEEDTIKIDLSNSAFRGGKWVRALKTAFEQNDLEQEIIIDETTYKAKDLYHLLHIKKGDTLGIIMDHAAHSENHQKITQHFKGCRQVLIESFYKNEDCEFATVNFHSYAAMSGKVMREAQVKEAIPVHFSRKYKQADIDCLLTEFQTAFEQE